MNIANVFVRIQKFGRLFAILVLLASFASIAFAQSQIVEALTSLCATGRSVLGVAAMLLVILAAVIYAAGQMMGAETRARATVWATAMFTGAIIGLLIYVVVPAVLTTIAGSDITVSC